MLEGGIHNYMKWAETQTHGQGESLFLGSNYVFDARGSVGSESVAGCACGMATNRMRKCVTSVCETDAGMSSYCRRL